MARGIQLTFPEKRQLAEFLERLGQKSIDDGKLSFLALAKKARKELKFEVTPGHVRKMLGEVGLRPSAENMELMKLRMDGLTGQLKPVADQELTKGGVLPHVLKELRNLTAAVLLVAEHLQALRPTDNKVEANQDNDPNLDDNGLPL